MAEPELIDTVKVFRDPDGYAASWGQGGTWDHRTPSEALEEVGRALDDHCGHDANEVAGGPESLEERIVLLRAQLALLEQAQAPGPVLDDARSHSSEPGAEGAHKPDRPFEGRGATDG